MDINLFNFSLHNPTPSMCDALLMSSLLDIGSSNIIGTLDILATAALASQSSAWQGCSNNSIKFGFKPATNSQPSTFVYARFASILSLALPFK